MKMSMQRKRSMVKRAWLMKGGLVLENMLATEKDGQQLSVFQLFYLSRSLLTET